MASNGLHYRRNADVADHLDPAISPHRLRGRGSWQGVIAALLSVISVTMLLVYF
jgi:hypothetical protein